MKVLQQEPGRTVVLEEGGAVRKSFSQGEPAALAALAAHEFDRMSRFGAALAGTPSATCPRPLELGDGPEPFVRMERAAGVPMQDYLATTELTADGREAIAAVLERALVCYVGTFGEPYWDFILRNMFYEPQRGLVTFLDFAVPAIYEPALERLSRFSPVEVSVGGLVASAIFEAGRPSRMYRRREHRQAFDLASIVFRRFLVGAGGPAPAPMTEAGVRAVVEITYGLASGGGSRARQAWYRSCGPALARPGAKLARLAA